MADQSDWAVRLIDRVTGPAKRMGGAVSALESRLSHVTKGLKSGAANAFATGITKASDALMLVGAASIGVGAGAVAATGKMLDFAQSARAGFQAVAKHGASAEKLFAHSRQLAEDLGLDVMNTSNAFQGFLAQGANPLMAENLVKMGADLKGVGKSGEQVESIFYNVSEILAQGVAQGDEFAPIFEAGINRAKLFEKMAAASGKSVEELNKQLHNGGLSADIVMPALLQTSTEFSGGKNPGDAAAKSAARVSGILARMKAKAQNALIDIGDAVAPAFMSALKDLQKEFGAVLGSGAFKEGVATAIEKIANIVRGAIPFARQFVASFIDGFKQAFPAIQGAVGILFDGFGDGASWMDNTRDFAGTLGKVAAAGVGVAEVFAGMAVVGVELGHSVEGLIWVWNGLISGIGAAIFWVDDFFANLGAKWDALDFAQIATNIIDGLVNGLKNGVSVVVDAVVNLGKSVMAAFESIFKIGSPSKVFEQYGDWSGEGYAIGLENSFDGVGPQFDSLAKGAAPDIGGANLGGGKTTMNFDITVNVGANDNAAALGKDIGRALEGELGSIFERWSLASG